MSLACVVPGYPLEIVRAIERFRGPLCIRESRFCNGFPTLACIECGKAFCVAHGNHAHCRLCAEEGLLCGMCAPRTSMRCGKEGCVARVEHCPTHGAPSTCTDDVRMCKVHQKNGHAQTCRHCFTEFYPRHALYCPFLSDMCFVRHKCVKRNKRKRKAELTSACLSEETSVSLFRRTHE